MDWTAIRTRYLRDAPAVRLGGIATSLARVSSFSRHSANREVVKRMMDESKMFIEWAAPELDVDTAAMLVDMQIQMVQWQRSWTGIWENLEKRQAVSDQCRQWSQRILDLSGLLRDVPS